MRKSLMFIGWKMAELTIYVVGFPFLFIGSWAVDFSDWCHDRALRHKQLPDTKPEETDG